MFARIGDGTVLGLGPVVRRHPQHRALASATFVVVGLVASGARADDARSGLALTWDAPRGCPSRDAVVTAATRGRREKQDAELRADAKITKGAAWHVVLRTSQAGAPDGERRLEAASCAELADATALVLALALETAARPADHAAEQAVAETNAVDAKGAGAESERPAATKSEQAEDAGRPEPLSTATLEPASRARDRRADAGHGREGELLRFAVGAAGALVTNVLPSAAPGATVTIGWTPGRFRLEATGGFFAAQSGAVPDSEAGARFRMRTIGGRACFDAIASAIHVGPCAGGTVHDVAARGTAVTEAYDATATWASVDGGVRAAFPLAGVAAVVASTELVTALARPTFVVDGEGVVHRPGAAGVRVVLGLEAHFP